MEENIIIKRGRGRPRLTEDEKNARIQARKNIIKNPIGRPRKYNTMDEYREYKRNKYYERKNKKKILF